jgi:hypothetical protein
MNAITIDLDQVGEEFLTHEISDEALEAAATTLPRAAEKTTYSIISPFCT